MGQTRWCVRCLPAGFANNTRPGLEHEGDRYFAGHPFCCQMERIDITLPICQTLGR